MRLVLTVLAFAACAALAPGASAAVVTPPGCHWVPTAERADVVGLWCRAPDGRARPTGQTLAQPPGDAWDGCPGGLMYDGMRCVTEARAIEAAERAPAPPRSSMVGPPPRTQPRMLLWRDGKRGRVTRGLACTDDREVTVCTPIRRY